MGRQCDIEVMSVVSESPVVSAGVSDGPGLLSAGGGGGTWGDKGAGNS